MAPRRDACDAAAAMRSPREGRCGATSRGDDTVTGGAGRDVVLGGGGRDVIVVRDGERDVVSCGSERARDPEIVTVLGAALTAVGARASQMTLLGGAATVAAPASVSTGCRGIGAAVACSDAGPRIVGWEGELAVCGRRPRAAVFREPPYAERLPTKEGATASSETACDRRDLASPESAPDTLRKRGLCSGFANPL